MKPDFHIVALSPETLIDSVHIELRKLGIVEESIPQRHRNLNRIYVIADKSGRLNETATSFLCYCAQRSRSVEGDTCRAYAESLVAWMNYLNQNCRDIHITREIDIQEYRNILCMKAPRGLGLSPATVNLRVGTILRFLKWGARYKSLITPLGEQLITASSPVQKYQGSSRFARNEVQIALPKTSTTSPSQISRPQLKQLYFNLGRPYDLMIRWAVSTGMRRSEICRLTVKDIETAVSTGSSRKLGELNVIRKGGRIQKIFVVRELIDESIWYINSERVKQNDDGEQYLFINALGRPVSKTSFTKAYARACKEIGAKSHLHMLRHTFAVTVLQILEDRAAKGAAINPLKILQSMMGHASIETTDIYLRTMQIISPAVEDALGFLYGDF
ncbi:integrase [Massilia sp. UYP32]|uniref:tyrosine-type recombinase/integrase n=1 Tax=Massilia sp. UYP32 TaxID=1756386 RepID=UPI003D1CDA13